MMGRFDRRAPARGGVRRAFVLAGLVFAVLSVGCALAAVTVGQVGHRPAAGSASPRIKHVWLIMLENHSFAENFGVPAQAFKPMQYIAKTLPSEGALLKHYFGVAHPSNSNYTALMSGQPPGLGFVSTHCWKTALFCTGSQFNCLYFTAFKLKRMTSDGVGVGQGCVYPDKISDIGTQLRSAGLTVKAYQEDMPAPCTHPVIGAYDETASSSTPGYETGNNPFMYFHSWIDNHKLCRADDVPLDRNTFEPLVGDLGSVETTPNLSWIGLNLCDDGHDHCPNFYADRANHKFFAKSAVCQGGPKASEACNAQSSWFLSQLIPKIMASPAYKEDGLIAIVWDEANFYTTSPYADYSACCHEPTQPGATGLPGVTGQVGSIDITPGAVRLLGALGDNAAGVLGILKVLFKGGLKGQPRGGDSGALLLSPFIKPGTVSNMSYNHYSLLATLQRIFGVARTGNAADPRLDTIGSDVFADAP